VFLSRVIPTKGIEVAVRAVVAANRARSRTCTLDIFGPVPSKEQPWFRELESQFSSEIRYLGEILPDEVQGRLRDYEVMLFPTTYAGEGFPGVLVEAMIAGLALLASDWMSNSEVVRQGENGFVLPASDPSAFADKLIELSADRSQLLSLQQQSAKTAKQFHSDVVMPILLDRVRCS
jgi:glycosyltransferase involved in cell wall biosynthesis